MPCSPRAAALDPSYPGAPALQRTLMGGGLMRCLAAMLDSNNAVLHVAAVNVAYAVSRAGGGRWDAALVAAGAVPLLVRILHTPDEAGPSASAHNRRPGSDEQAAGPAAERPALSLGEIVWTAVETLLYIASRRCAAHLAAIVAAGGIPALFRQLASKRCQRSAASVLQLLFDGSPERCSLARAAGAVPALQRLLSSSDGDTRQAAAAVLGMLRACEMELLARPEGSGSTATALSPPAVPQATTSTACKRCAAPGCSATAGLRRCSGCKAVRYCSLACSRAHWQAHKVECRRIQAQRAAEQAAAGDGQSAAAAGKPAAVQP